MIEEIMLTIKNRVLLKPMHIGHDLIMFAIIIEVCIVILPFLLRVLYGIHKKTIAYERELKMIHPFEIIRLPNI